MLEDALKRIILLCYTTKTISHILHYLKCYMGTTVKRFHNLDPKLLEGLSIWFWVRENTTFINTTLIDLLGDYWYAPPNLFKEWQDWLWFCSIPLGYLIGLIIGPWIRKEEAFDDAKPDCTSTFYNKRNIEYMTILHTLTGGRDDT